MSMSKLLTKTKLRNLSLLLRIYLSFAIVIIVFACSSVITYFTQNTISTAYSSVENESMPISTQAIRLEVAMYQANQSLLRITNAQTPEVVEQYESQFNLNRANLRKALSNLKLVADDANSLAAFDKKLQTMQPDYQGTETLLDKVTQYVSSYLAETENIASARKAYLVEKTKTEAAQAQLFSLINTMAVNVVGFISRIDDSFLTKQSFDLAAVRTELEQKLHLAFNAQNSDDVLKYYKDNQGIITRFKDIVAIITTDAPGFATDHENAFFIPIYKEASTKEGVLYRSYELAKQKENLDKQAYDSNSYIIQARNTLAELQAHADSFAKFAAQEVNANIITSLEVIFGGLILVIIIAVVISVSLARSIRGPLEKLIALIDKAAGGDLTDSYEDNAKDEFAQLASSVNKMIDQTRDVVSRLKNAVDSLRHTADKNLSVVRESNEALDVQRKEAFMIASSTSELEQTLAQVVDSAQKTLNEVTNVGNVSEQGRNIMSENITTTHTLDSRLKETSAAISSVNQMGDKIGHVVSVITNIAEQTNLLALNAAIEAARAGEHGRGFAVVADEVRTLANRTSESTKEITQVISELRTTISRAVSVIGTCNEEMASSLTQSSKANSAIEEIMGYITTIEQMTSQIVESAHEQEIATHEINQNITRISSLADKNYEGISNIQDSSENLNKIASEQIDIVNMFKI